MGELSVRELPLFPLPEVVLFPQEVLPLHIFESRYRIMLQSVLETDSMFGIVKWDPSTKSMANVGCCAQIIKLLKEQGIMIQTFKFLLYQEHFLSMQFLLQVVFLYDPAFHILFANG